jgi:antitoxin VapB
MDMDLGIERGGDEIRIRPARRSLSGVLAKFSSFSTDFMAEGRGDQKQAGRKLAPLEHLAAQYFQKNNGT